jgi:hypothetical protein
MNDGNQNHNNKIRHEIYPSSTNENGFWELKKRGSLLTLVLVRTFVPWEETSDVFLVTRKVDFQIST